jgi:hypothetical protein
MQIRKRCCSPLGRNIISGGKEKNILQGQIWDPCSLWFSGSNQLQYNEKAENKEGEKKWKEER